jgi:hypothetical protein
VRFHEKSRHIVTGFFYLFLNSFFLYNKGMDSDSWGKSRQQLIETVLALIGIALIAIVVVATLYRAPSCTDGKQDQHELGIDCGGPCPYLCSADEKDPTVLFVRAISPQAGRSDVIAYIDNTNMGAQLVNAPITVDLYGPNNSLVATRSGTVTIPPLTTEPLFIPDFYNGSQQVTQAFVTFTSTSSIPWVTAIKPAALATSATSISNSMQPRITAIVTNPTTIPLQNVKVVVTVFNASNTVVGASQTIISSLPGKASAPVVFTWNEPFATPGVRAEIVRAF